MPLYEYCCHDCSAEFEEVVPFAKADEVVCDACGSDNTQRMASTFSTSIKTSCSQAPGQVCGLGG